MNYTFTDKNKRIAFILMAVGAVSLIGGFIADPHRAWPNLLVNSFFFMAIALGALFFVAVQYASEAGWSAVIKRVPEAIAHYLPFGAVAMLIVILSAVFHFNHIYHWMEPELYDTTSEHYDKIIAGKRAFLNPVFFVIRSVVYLGGWLLFFRAFMKKSAIEAAGIDVPNYRKSMSLAAWFLVFFAVTSSTSAWDWLMSIDTHWFSTLFGWYVFAGMFVSAMVMITLIVLHLKSKGLLPEVTDNHIHDLGKFVFAFSIFWTYLWFSQFMLIWYSNIPEEVTYFMDRFENYKILFIGNFFINFIFPFIVLMKRGAKRNYKLLFFVGCVLIIGHWSDTFVMVMPGTVKEHWHLGWVELGTALGFLGLFGYVVLNALSKKPVSNPTHVFYEESIHHHI